MKTGFIEKTQLKRSLDRNEAFWSGELKEGPLMWVTVPFAYKGTTPPEPDEEEKMWTDVDFYVESMEDELSRTHYAGDALPVCHPWIGPDQVAGWLGSEMTLMPKEFTSWIKPFVDDWGKYSDLHIDPENRWWKLYLELLVRCSEVGRDKWITAFPDLHTGIDGLGAIRGPENLMIDMLTEPDSVHRGMHQMTELWKSVVDIVSDVIMPTGQGSSNWTMGYSSKRCLCIGQNDFACLISTEMFEEFCFQDNVECCNYVDYSIYHLDGPNGARHLSKILEIEKLSCIQWIQGAGNPYPSKWLDLLKQIQDAGKSVQIYYGPTHGGEADLQSELEILCDALDKERLFFWAILDSTEKADALVGRVNGQK